MGTVSAQATEESAWPDAEVDIRVVELLLLSSLGVGWIVAGGRGKSFGVGVGCVKNSMTRRNVQQFELVIDISLFNASLRLLYKEDSPWLKGRHFTIQKGTYRYTVLFQAQTYS